MSEEDKLANARAQGQAQFDSIREMVDALEKAREVCAVGTGATDRELNDIVEDVERAIHEDALAVEVRSGWYVPTARPDPDVKPAEYRILLCTGGPAVQITGELNEHCEPETARMEVQDWFTPWIEFWPVLAPLTKESIEAAAKQVIGETDKVRAVLLAYARCFWFGE